MPKYYSPDGNLEVWEEKPEGYYTVEEWQELHPAPAPPEPTIDEQLAELDAQYQAQKYSLIAEYTDALIHGDNEAQELVQTEMTDLDTWYDEEYNKIVGGEEQ